MKKGKVFQEDFFELEMTYSYGKHQDLTHKKLLMFISIDLVQKLCIYLSIYFWQHAEDLHHVIK